MGQYHYLINLDKKQFVHPHQIGNGLKLKEQVGWEYSTATALVLLLAASSRDGGRGGGDFHALHPLIGAWAATVLLSSATMPSWRTFPAVMRRNYTKPVPKLPKLKWTAVVIRMAGPTFRRRCAK